MDYINYTTTHPTSGMMPDGGWMYQFGPIEVTLSPTRPFLHEVMWLYAVKARDRRLTAEIQRACLEVVDVCQSSSMQNHSSYRKRAFTDRMQRQGLTPAQLSVFTEANEWMQLVRN